MYTSIMIDTYLSNIPGANIISIQIPNKHQPPTHYLKSHDIVKIILH